MLPPSLMSVLLDSARSAEPPRKVGSRRAMALMQASEAERVACFLGSANRLSNSAAPPPVGPGLLVGRALDPPAVVDAVGDVEVLVRVPAVGLLGRPDLVLAEGAAVGLGGVLGVGCPPGDVAAQPDEAGPAGLVDGGLVGGRDRLGGGGGLDVVGG